MGERPTVSILMGVYNEAEYLETSIESILSQTYSDIEFLIVDDASTDDSAAIIDSYDDDRITLIENQTNQGLTVSLNRALEHASGKYVARQDADDISEPDRIGRQVSFLERYDDVALVGSGATLIDADGTPISTRIGYCNPTYDDFLEKNRLVHGSILARRSVLDALGGYDEFFRYSQDYELWLRLLEDHRVANIPDALYRLRIHDESVYFSQKDESALYSTFAKHLSTGVAEPALKEELEERGITQYWEYLSDSQQAVVHTDLATRYLRYGHNEPALRECRNAREAAGLTLELLSLTLLARTGQYPMRLVKWSFRKHMNLKTRVHNRWNCPYETTDTSGCEKAETQGE